MREPPYKIPSAPGNHTKVGTGVTINYAADNTNSAAVNAGQGVERGHCLRGKPSDLRRRDGEYALRKKAKARKESTEQRSRLETAQETMVSRVYAANPKTISLLISQLPIAINLGKGIIPRSST